MIVLSDLTSDARLPIDTLSVFFIIIEHRVYVPSESTLMNRSDLLIGPTFSGLHEHIQMIHDYRIKMTN